MLHATGIDTSNSAGKRDFVSWKAKVYKLNISKFFDVQFKNKTRWIRCWGVKTCSYRFEKIKWCSDKEVMKKAVHNRLNTKVNNLKKKIPDAFCLS